MSQSFWQGPAGVKIRILDHYTTKILFQKGRVSILNAIG